MSRGDATRAAAAQPFPSPKTVEHHLRHVYQKLGVRSRAELAAALGGAGGGAGFTLPAGGSPGGAGASDALRSRRPAQDAAGDRR